MSNSFFRIPQLPGRQHFPIDEDGSHLITSSSTRLSNFSKLPSVSSERVPAITTDGNEANPRAFAGRHEPQQSLGKPSRKPMINAVDALATLLCFLCLIGAAIVISHSFKYASELGYTKQIIAIGFLLGVMTQCMLRVVPHAFLLVEARYGRSTLQNFDGLLRWTPLANHLGAVWRILLILLLLLPLGLSVGYKRYTGGIGYGHSQNNVITFGPSAPPGTQGINSTSTTITNATSPFVAATLFSNATFDFTANTSHVYGYNLVLLSRTTAAALDGPMPEHVTSMQRSLGPAEAMTISANVRGTVSEYHPSTARTNTSWSTPWKYGGWNSVNLFNGYKFGFLAVSTAGTDDLEAFNSSWVYLGAFPTENSDTDDQVTFQKQSAFVTVSRKQCRATWNVTSSSMLLASASCADPLWEGYQYYTSCQLGVGNGMPFITSEWLAPFATTRNTSQWAMPSFAMVVASMYQARIASSYGAVPLQTNGLVANYWYERDDVDASSPFNLTSGRYVERYNGGLTRIVRRPVLRADASLYVILAIQPLLTLLGFITILVLHRVPIGHGFGLISLLAGVDREELDVLAGATLSGQTGKSVRVAVNVVEEADLGDRPVAKLKYVIGRHPRKHQRLNPKIKYH